jgi:hypothetical protein
MTTLGVNTKNWSNATSIVSGKLQPFGLCDKKDDKMLYQPKTTTRAILKIVEECDL